MTIRSTAAIAAVVTIFLVAACNTGSPTAAPSGGGDKGNIKIGVDLPLSGGELPNGQPTLNGIQLALNDAGGVAGGYSVTLDVRDDAVNGVHNPDQGATNANALVADSSVVGMVGPYNSNVGRAEIPVTAPAGLLQCSPANTNTYLTKPDPSNNNQLLRGDNPPSYVRVATTDDVQGPALASYLYNDLGIQSVFIVDDTETYGKGLADTFQARYEELGGTVTDRQGVANTDGTADYAPILTAAQSGNPGAVFFGGVTTTGGGKLRAQMADNGMGNLPYIGGDGIVDGSGSTTGSFVNLAGAAATDSYGSVAAIHDIPNPDQFKSDYQAAYNGEDPGAYSAPGYACTQILLQAINAVADQATDMADLRAKVRAYVIDASSPFDTVLGPVSFDENGDTSQHIISFYKTDLSTDPADWVFVKQQDFGAQ